MTRKFKLICIIAAAVLLITTAAYGVYYLYWSYHPRFVISRVVGYGDIYGSGEDDENELIVGSFSARVPMAKSISEKGLELLDWIAGIDYELFNTYAPPYDIKVSGENEDGKVTLRYVGYVTTQDGETIEYNKERTFDIDFIKDEDFFNNPPLPISVARY